MEIADWITRHARPLAGMSVPETRKLEQFDSVSVQRAEMEADAAPQAQRDGRAGTGASSSSSVAGLGLALYAGSTVFNSGQSTLAKLIGETKRGATSS